MNPGSFLPAVVIAPYEGSQRVNRLVQVGDDGVVIAPYEGSQPEQQPDAPPTTMIVIIARRGLRAVMAAGLMVNDATSGFAVRAYVAHRYRELDEQENQ